ncbi:MAG: S9 family peptidase [Anaerolineae bacterium]|nr:S9 family peptidase [Anaerolineae bacterium]
MITDPFLQQLLYLPAILHAELSPDRKWVAFMWYRVHANIDVFAVPVGVDAAPAPIALTHTPEATMFVSWTPDSRAVIVSEDHDRDERAALYRVDLDRPGEMQRLTDDRPDYFVRGGDLHPDGKTLFYGANYDFGAGKEIEPTWIYRHDLGTGKRVPIARPQKPTWAMPSLNTKGTHVLYMRRDRHPAGMQYWLVDVEGKEDREILSFGDAVKVRARWFPDGEHILFLTESKDGMEQDHMTLGVYNPFEGGFRWLLDDPARHIESAWVAPDGAVIVDEVRDARHAPTYIGELGRSEQPFPDLPGNLVPLGRAPDGAWIAQYYSSASPTDLVRFTGDAQSPADLTSLIDPWAHTQLDPAALISAEDFRWKSTDGMSIQGWLYRAKDNPKRAIIRVHGGPSAHDEDKINTEAQYWAANGFNVLAVNYRGSTGFGLRFRQAIKVDGWGGREQDDIAAGAQALIKAGLAEPGRVGVTGTSYGGYSAWVQITRYPPEVIAAAAPICGMTDLVVDYHTTRPDLRPLSAEMMGGTPDEVPEKYHERSPINYVHRIKGKLLIVQGAQDPNVSPANVEEVTKRLKEHNIPYNLLVFEDEGHGIIKPENQARLFTYLADFFDKALG